MSSARWIVWIALPIGVLPLHASERPLIVVHDAGGLSAKPYYRALQLPDREGDRPTVSIPPDLAPPAEPYNEGHMLPVRSHLLRPGPVTPRAIPSPGLKPMFLIGDDRLSRAWLKERIQALRHLGAVGFVVEVESKPALDDLRHLASGLALVPASGDDFAERLGLHRYPVLITPTGIEQ